MSPLSVYRWNGTISECIHGTGGDWAPTDGTVFSDSNNPAMFSTSMTGMALESYLMQEYPAEWTYPTIVDFNAGGGTDFFDAVWNQCQSAGSRIVIRLHGGTTYHQTRFVPIPIGTSNILYAMGAWHPNLQGFISNGPGHAIIQMDANSYTSAQLAAIEALPTSQVLQAALLRLDGARRVLAGVRFQAADQQNINAVHSSVLDYTHDPILPQPAPHVGVFLFPSTGGSAYLSHLDLVGAARAINSAPPFECANIGSQYGDFRYWNVASDGRRHASIDPARPRRSGGMMANNDTWYGKNLYLHHFALSRWAGNDGGQTTVRSYEMDNVQMHDITNTQNTDPALNGGASLGGWSNPACIGFETTISPITLRNMRLTVDNPSTTTAIQQHISLSYVPSGAFPSTPTSGGPLTIIGGTFHNTIWPALDGFLTMRIKNEIFWYNLATYIFVWNAAQTVRKTGVFYTGAWNNTAIASWISTNGYTPATHYIVRPSNT